MSNISLRRNSFLIHRAIGIDLALPSAEQGRPRIAGNPQREIVTGTGRSRGLAQGYLAAEEDRALDPQVELLRRRAW